MIKDKKVIAISLARGGSKRVPNKNIIEICDKPMIQYTIEEAKKSKYIDEYIVSSDSDDILDVAKKLDCKIYKRKNVLDTQTSAEGLIETITNVYGSNIINSEPFILVELMVTNPLKTYEDIDNTIEKIFNGNCSVSVIRIFDHHPSRIKMIENGYLEDFWPEEPESRRQDLIPPAYVRNGSIYVMWWNDLFMNNQRLCGKIVPYIMSNENTINIDEPEDLELAKILIQKRLK